MLAASKCPGAARHIERVGSVLGGVFLVRKLSFSRLFILKTTEYLPRQAGSGSI